MATDVRNRRDELARLLDERTPAWERAQIFPVRYACTEEEYISLDGNQLIEYDDGFLEILPMPTIYHQLILMYLARALNDFAAPRELGTVVPAPYRVRIGRGRMREPDVLFIKSEHGSWIGKDFCEKADLVIEIVSENNRKHDLVTKRDEYARAGIPEYGILDPEEGTITVLWLKSRAKTYVEHGMFRKGERAESRLLGGFGVDVTTAVTQKPAGAR